jgi:hypothetical protein
VGVVKRGRHVVVIGPQVEPPRRGGGRGKLIRDLIDDWRARRRGPALKPAPRLAPEKAASWS